MSHSDQAPSKEHIAQFCRKHRICKMAVLGEILSEVFGPATELNVVVEFESGHVPGFFALARMEREFCGIFGGRKAGFLTPEDLDRYAPREMLRNAEVQYEA